MQYTTTHGPLQSVRQLFYQDFKDTFVCNTQPSCLTCTATVGCFIRISKILLYAIHNEEDIWQFIREVVLSGFQRYFCMQYTTAVALSVVILELFYQDFKDTFVCNTQRIGLGSNHLRCCFIRISKILLYAIHNIDIDTVADVDVVLSGFQRYFCMQYTTFFRNAQQAHRLFYQDFKDTFVCNTQLRACARLPRSRCFIRISKILLYAIHNYSRKTFHA